MRHWFPLALLAVLACLLGGCTTPSIPEASIRVQILTAAVFRFEAPLGGILYEWLLSDGTSSDERIIEHTFAEAGEYTVNLKMVDPSGDATFAHVTVTAYRDIYVNDVKPKPEDNMPHDYVSLQAAIDVAEPNDLILASGVFSESLVIESPVRLRGPCTLEADSDETLLTIDRIEGVFIDRITFQGSGDEASIGGAVRLLYADAVFSDCRFAEFRAEFGGAVHAFESGAEFVRCTFEDNEGEVDGGAVYVQGNRRFPVFDACTFRDNEAAAGAGIAVRWTETEARPSQVFAARDSLFERNRATGGYIGSNLVGGAIHIGLGIAAVLEDNTYFNNSPTDVFRE